MYRVYLNDILQDEKDIKGIAEGAEFTIIREFGIGNAEQILRDKTDVQLKFAGQAYQLFCDRRRENYCQNITVRVEYFCAPTWDVIFSGIIQQKNVELNFNKCIANVTAIRDNSFSGLVRDYLNTDIGLYNTKTISCDDLAVISQSYVISTDPTNVAGSQVSVIGFDVLDVLQYYLNYITDNQIEVRSDYLTGTSLGDVRFFITTGYNLHNTSGTLEQTHPMLSFQKVFEELRKKLKIYMGIEYDTNDVPYLRIERESYFFDTSEQLLNITETPSEIIEKIDPSLLYNQINVGSSTWELQDGSAEDYPQEKLIAWNEEQYTNCGGCGGEKDSTLDLVSDFIIDSNVIYEAAQAVGDYANDEAVFLIHYYVDVADNQRYALITNDDVYGKDIYNEEITNELVLEKWSATSCAATYRTPVNGFKVQSTGINTIITNAADSTVGVNQNAQNNFQGTVIYDNGGNISTLDTYAANPYGPDNPQATPFVDNTSVFTVPTNGTYSFHARTTMLMCDPDNGFIDDSINVKYTLGIEIYSDNTFATKLYEYVDVLDGIYPYEPWDLEVTSGDVTLSAGNCVFVKHLVEMDGTGGVWNADGDLCETNTVFELVGDDNNCQDVEQSTSALPYVLEFKYPVCYDDFKNMRENKRGYITVNGLQYWIREIKYRPGKLSDLVLLGANSQCSACGV